MTTPFSRIVTRDGSGERTFGQSPIERKFPGYIKGSVTLAMLALVAFTVDFHGMKEVLSGILWREMLLALIAYHVGILARSYRWRALLEGQGLHISYGRLVNLYYVGAFFNLFLPSGFGGDAVKIYELSRQGSSGTIATSTVVLDRFMGLAVLFAMALLALPFSWHLVPLSMSLLLLGITAGLAFSVWLFLNRRVLEWLALRIAPLRMVLSNEKVSVFYDSFHRYPGGALLRSAAASLFFNITLILQHIYLAKTVKALVSTWYFFTFVPILSSLVALPISIGGIGVRESGYMILFGRAGVAYDRSVSMSLLFYVLALSAGLWGGPLYLWQTICEMYRKSRTADKK
jgi:glycosyltransferase 2 family protein